MSNIAYSDISSSRAVSSYTSLHAAQNNLLYFINETAAGSGKDGYVFELGDMDASAAINVDPSFAQLLEDISGLGAADATLEFDVSLSQFQGLFSVQIDSSDLNNVEAEDVLFKVNDICDNTYNDISDVIQVGKFFTDISYSEAIVKSGAVNSYYPLQAVKHDFVRHLANKITGGYSASDIFTNEAQLVNAVSTLDSQFTTILNGIITSAAALDPQPGSYTGSYSSMIQAANQLYNLNLQSDPSMNTGRTGQFFDDVSASNSASADGNGGYGPINIPLRFHSGDRIAVLLTYKPQNSVFAPNQASIPNRVYKTFFRLV